MSPYEKASDILSSLHHVNKKYKKLYCYPSQIKILKLLKQYHKIKYSIATLNRRLRVIEDEGLIKRTRRSRNDKKLGKVFESTLYEITLKGYYHLLRLGVKVFDIIKKMVNGKNGEKKKEATAARINGDGYPLITYQEHIKSI
jgi:DNA-binding HxlR family transcriptional regulator